MEILTSKELREISKEWFKNFRSEPVLDTNYRLFTLPDKQLFRTVVYSIGGATVSAIELQQRINEHKIVITKAIIYGVAMECQPIYNPCYMPLCLDGFVVKYGRMPTKGADKVTIVVSNDWFLKLTFPRFEHVFCEIISYIGWEFGT